MQSSCDSFSRLLLWFLLLHQEFARAVLRVSIPSSPIRALPFSDLRLPCNFSDPSRPISLRGLAVTWKRDDQLVAEYREGFQAMRAGAQMLEERLRAGDASLLLPQLQDADSGVYTCLVIFTPEKEEGSFELTVEAEPHVALGPTKLQLAKRGALTCTVTGFYPGNVSVEWLKDGAFVKGPKTSLHQDSHNGLYNASSILELTPEVADANTNFSCRVTHQSLKSPHEENFQVQLQALPSLQVFPVVSKNTLAAIKCLVSGFYPQDVKVRWLRNGMPQEPMGSLPQTLPNGTFSMKSTIWSQEVDPNVSYVCRVEHKAWDAPQELAAHWQPQEEGDGLPSPTPQHPQLPGEEGMPCSCSPIPVPTSPTCATGTVAMWCWIVFVLGVLFFVAGGVMLYLASKKRKNKSYPDTRNKHNFHCDSAEIMLDREKEQVPGGTTTSM